MFIFMQNIILILHFFLEIFQRYYKLIFWGGYFRHTWPRPPKAIPMACRKLWYFFVNKKSTLSISFFCRYYALKNPTIWLAKNIFGNNTRTRILPDTGFAVESQDSKEEFSFWIAFRKITKFSKKKMQNTLFWGRSCQNLDKNQFFTKVRLRHILPSIVP